jgi:hypothetical protein
MSRKKAVPKKRILPDLNANLKARTDQNRQQRQTDLETLLSQPGYMYADLHPQRYAKLQPAYNQFGVYHFFSVDGEQVESMYIGESHTGSLDWGLSSRIKQHLNTGGAVTGNLAKKMVMAGTATNRKAARDFIRANFYVQFLITPTPSQALLLESYAVSVLAPKYNLCSGRDEDEGEAEEDESVEPLQD